MARTWLGINDVGVGNSGAVSDVGWVAVTSDATTICTIGIQEGAERLWVEVEASDTLTTFTCQGRVHPLGSFQELSASASDWTTGMTLPILAASGALTTLASDATGYFYMDVKGLESVRLLGSITGGGNARCFWHQR